MWSFKKQTLTAGSAACLKSLWRYSINQTDARKNDGGNQLSQRGPKLDHRNHWQLGRNEWWLEPKSAISDLPNEWLHIPEAYREAAKATFMLKEELVPKGLGRDCHQPQRRYKGHCWLKTLPELLSGYHKTQSPGKAKNASQPSPEPLWLLPCALCPYQTALTSSRVTR